MKNRLIILLFLFSVLGIKADNIKKVLLDFNVESYTPLETTNLLISENISITFNLDFAQPIIQYPDVLINKVLANDSGSWGITSSNTLTFTPNSDWALGSLISIKINSIQSINGDEFNGVQSEFEFIVDSGNDYGIEEILIPTIATRDNNGTPHNIPLKLVLPVDRVNPVPIHFYVHGGGWLGGTETDSFAQVGPQANYLAKHLGVATIGIAYRCSGSNGTFAQAMEDIESAYQWVIANAATYNLDINNSFFEGGSAGTPLASLTAQIHAEVKAFVGFNGIYNFQENIGPFALGNAYEQEIPSTAANSTFYNLRTTPPITLLMHGDADTTIDYTQSTLFAQKINDNGGQAEVIIYPGEEHAFFNAAKDEFEDTLYEFANFLKENGFAQLINNPDVDGDGVLNTADLCPETPAGATVDSDGCIVYQNAVTITRVIDGVSNADCSGAAAGGRPKMIEMYVNGTVNFTGWNIEVQTNGDVGGVWNQTILSSLGELTNTFFYIMHDAAGSNKVVFENMYPPGASLPQKIINMWLTGNDPVRITDNSGIVIDKFGDGSDVSATGDHNNPWNYADGVAKRNDGSEPNGGVFTESNWTFINWASDGSVTCTDMATDIEFGDFSTTTLSVITKNITVQLNTDGLATITTNQIDNSSTGAGGIASYSLDVTNFTCEDTGENTVNLTVIDNKGGSASTTAIVLIEDSIVPTVLTKNITVELDADGLATITTNQIDNGATDNCSIASSSLDITSFTCANIGSNTVTLTVNDANGNSNSKTATVTIADSEAPTVLTQNITVELDADGLATITTNQINNSSTDNCSIATSSLDITNFTCANIGPNTVNLTINDVNGNSSSASAIVTIVDAVAPNVITQNITVQLDGTGNATITVAEIENGSTDACGIASSSLDTASFTIADLGPNTVNLTVTDVNGNSSAAPATVTVVDTVVPVVITQDITIQLNSDGLATITAAQIDNGSTAEVPIASYMLDITSFTCEDIGLNTVNLTVTDINDISATASATVTVEDNIAPTVITNNITVQLNSDGLATISTNQIDNSSTDNCAIFSYSLNITEFDCSSIGENTVSLTVTDVNENSASAIAIVTVEDNISPTVLTQDITIQLNSNGSATITASQIDNSSIDNCDIATYSLNITAFNCESIGENTVSLTVTDVNDNSASATATVMVEDTTAPTVNTQNITVQLDSEGAANITSEMIDAISTDNCEIDSYEIDVTNFTCEDIGENTVTLTVTDIYGNSDFATATVTVEDTVAPNVVTVEPFTLQLDAEGSTLNIDVEDIENGSTDTCGIDTYSLDINTFDCTNVGENTVTLTITDVNGNSAIATTIVTIEDISIATVITQDITITLNSRGEASITTDLIDNGSFDNCGIASISLDRTNFDCATIGEHIVTLTILDNSDNSSSETAIVTVTSFDIDGDLIADNCDDDMDGDGILNDVDNCETTYNPDQKDVDFNGIGDTCDEAPTVAAKGFSPNGDGIGDTFIIEGLHRFPDSTLEIYNRWGNKVYSQTSYQNDWDGIANGKGVLRKNQKLPAGPYFYVLIAKQNQIYKGWIYINY